MEAGLASHVWSIEEICALLSEPKPTTAKWENAMILSALGEDTAGGTILLFGAKKR